MKQMLCAAIGTRRLLRLAYGGGLRIVEPYCYGTTQEGREIVSVFQTSGFSRSGAASGWKTLHVDEVTELSVSPERFLQNQPDYNPQDPGVAVVWCQV